MSRAAVAAARRTVVKVGSSSLTTAEGGLDEARVDALVDALAARAGEVVLVCSGAIAAGLAPLGLTRRPRDLATQQAAASVGQSLLVQRYATAFGRHGRTVGQVLLTADDVVRRSHYRNAQTTLERLLALGVVPVVNENDAVATEEIRFGDNDRLAALVAHLVRADALVLLSDVDGLYDGDPRRPGTAAAHRGRAAARPRRGGRRRRRARAWAPAGWPPRSTPPASRPARASPCCWRAATLRRRCCAGEGGTCSPRPARAGPRACSGWRTRRPRAAGSCSTRARSRRCAAVGCPCCRRGSPRSRASSRRATPSSWSTRAVTPVARGLVAYDAAELPALLGRSTRELGLREVVHRDDLVVLLRSG